MKSLGSIFSILKRTPASRVKGKYLSILTNGCVQFDAASWIKDGNAKEVFEIRKPGDIFMPRTNVSTAYVFCKNTDFFAYPNNFNYYVKYYRNTFQHGGISLEEMLIPIISLSPKA